MKKLLSVGVIVLFLGVACAPSINANVGKKSELVAITTEICGRGGGKHTVQLTKEEVEEVERLIDDIEQRLDGVETRDEIVEIFNEAVVELDKYGLLGGLSVKQAQRLVTGEYQNLKIMKLIEKLFDRNPTIWEDCENWFCLIAGRTTYTGTYGPVWGTLYYILGNFLRIFPGGFGYIIYSLMLLFYLPGAISNFNPFAIGNTMSFGLLDVQFDMFGNYYSNSYPAEGWIWTIGTNGIWKKENIIYGDLGDYPLIFLIFFTYMKFGYTGGLGFTGLKMTLPLTGEDNFYLGSALGVKIEVFN